uniref:Uncharacterized protein n=1 Tax=Triticum urartu TaxID=4572 RepID=A0A8R7TS54_TRIUA
MLAGSRLRSKITGQLIFSRRTCGGRPLGVSEFRNSGAHNLGRLILLYHHQFLTENLRTMDQIVLSYYAIVLFVLYTAKDTISLV